jgi:arylsulfatase A-like enzyme
MNFVLVTVDSLRADRVGRNGYARDTTPFLDRLAENSVFFERAYSPSSHTREAVPSILTGTYPSKAVTRTYRIRQPTVANLLNEAGYETGGFVSGPFFTTRKGYDEDFDTFDSSYSRYTFPMVAQYWWEILSNTQFRDGFDVNEALVSFAEGTEEPFFAWGHYMEPHAPYDRWDENWFGGEETERVTQAAFRKAKHLPSWFTNEETRRMLVDGYDNSVRQFDRVMRDLFGRLEDSGVLDDTVVFVTSDHGELLGEDGRYEHGESLDPELLRVPLWIHGDRVGTVGKPVSTVDILPTIAQKTGLEVDCDGIPLDGESEKLRDIRASRYGYIRREQKELVRA